MSGILKVCIPIDHENSQFLSKIISGKQRKLTPWKLLAEKDKYCFLFKITSFMYFFLVMNHVCCYIKVLFEFQLLLIFIYVKAYVLYKLILCQTCTVEKNVENVSMWDYKLINSYLLKCFNDIHSKSHMIFKILFIRVLINLFICIYCIKSDHFRNLGRILSCML